MGARNHPTIDEESYDAGRRRGWLSGYYVGILSGVFATAVILIVTA